jgi:carotenoid cleavage dioxygenase-like enzyme
MVDDFRRSFEDFQSQTETRHVKMRKHLSAAQDRKIQDKRILIELETAHMTPEMRQDKIKEFQFKMNHAKALVRYLYIYFRKSEVHFEDIDRPLNCILQLLITEQKSGGSRS